MCLTGVTDGDGDYGGDEDCTIRVLLNGAISSVGNFDTEQDESGFGYDYLVIHDVRYAGTGEVRPL